MKQKPLPWYAWAWSALPLALILHGGALGGLLGALTFAINIRLFRSRHRLVLRFALSGLTSMAALLAYLTVIGLMQRAMQNPRSPSL